MNKISGIINIALSNIGKTPKITAESKPVGLVQQTISNLSSHNTINKTRNPIYAFMLSHKIKGGTAFGYYPKNYLKLISREFVPAEPERTIKWGGKEMKLRARKAYYSEVFEFLPYYHVDKLISNGKGTGTRSIQEVVKKSLADIETQGRVKLEAACIDDKTAPGGFYYKLGFRFCDKTMNEKCAKWLEAGGKKEDAPFAIGEMFLPKENISHCLNYGKV